MTREDSVICAAHEASFGRINDSVGELRRNQIDHGQKIDTLLARVNLFRGGILFGSFILSIVATLMCGVLALKLVDKSSSISFHFNSEAEAREVAAMLQQHKGKLQ